MGGPEPEPSTGTGAKKGPAPKPDPTRPLPRLDALGALQVLLGMPARDVARMFQPVVDVVSNGVNNPPVALAALTTLKTPAAAPREISVPFAVNARFEALRQAHLDQARKTDNFGKERCTTLVREKATGELTQINEVVGTGKSCEPQLTVDESKYELVGSFHTHVNLKQAFPGVDPADPNLAFSAGDVVFQSQQKYPISIAQGADRQYMLVRTEATRVFTEAEAAAVKAEYAKQLNAASGGGGRLQGFEDVTLRLAKDLAEKNGFALYEGTNGTFTRVEPK